jgi:hypothetical protein
MQNELIQQTATHTQQAYDGSLEELVNRDITVKDMEFLEEEMKIRENQKFLDFTQQVKNQNGVTVGMGRLQKQVLIPYYISMHDGL